MKWFVTLAIGGGYAAITWHFGWPGLVAAAAHLAILAFFARKL